MAKERDVVTFDGDVNVLKGASALVWDTGEG